MRLLDLRVALDQAGNNIEAIENGVEPPPTNTDQFVVH